MRQVETVNQTAPTGSPSEANEEDAWFILVEFVQIATRKETGVSGVQSQNAESRLREILQPYSKITLKSFEHRTKQ
jgi:hypothetical protein